MAEAAAAAAKETKAPFDHRIYCVWVRGVEGQKAIAVDVQPQKAIVKIEFLSRHGNRKEVCLRN